MWPSQGTEFLRANAGEQRGDWLPTRISGSLSCGAKEVRSPCAWRGGSASWLSSHGRGLGPRDALKKDSRGLCRGALKSGPGNRGRSACGPTHVARLEFPRETGLILRCAGKAGNPFQTKQGNRLSCRDQEGRRGSDEVVPGPSVFPSRRGLTPRVSFAFTALKSTDTPRREPRGLRDLAEPKPHL